MVRYREHNHLTTVFALAYSTPRNKSGSGGVTSTNQSLNQKTHSNMRIQSDSVNSASALNLQPVADVLPDEFAQLDFDYVLDMLVELVFEPEFAQPYRVRIDLETVEACETLAEAEPAFADAKSELFEAAALERGPALSTTTRKPAAKGEYLVAGCPHPAQP